MAENPSYNSEYGGTTVEQCQAMIRKNLRDSTVKHIRKQMEKAGCPIGNNFIRAMDCRGITTEHVRGFYLSRLGVIMCSNVIRTQDDVNQTVTHELIHAFDHCHAANFDVTNCAFRACSEECIRRITTEAIQVTPSCSGADVKEVIKDVWDVRYNDTQPF